MEHPIVRDYIRVLEQQRHAPLWKRIGQVVLVILYIVFAVFATIVLWHQNQEGRPYVNPTGLMVPVGVALASHYYQKARLDKKLAIARQAVPVWVRLVQANHRLFRSGSKGETLPCLVVFSFEVNGASPQMEEMAYRIFSLKDKSQTDPDLAYVRSLTADERAVHYRRRQLPPSFVGNSIPMYVADLFILRRNLKHAMLTEPCLMCLAGKEVDGIELVPWQVLEGRL